MSCDSCNSNDTCNSCNQCNNIGLCNTDNICNINNSCNVNNLCNIDNLCNINNLCNTNNLCNINHLCDINNLCNINNSCNVNNLCNICNPYDVVYITTAPNILSISTGGVGIPANSCSIPVGTVTVITGFSTVPLVNIGGIVLNNSDVTIVSSGKVRSTNFILNNGPATSGLRSIRSSGKIRSTGQFCVMASPTVTNSQPQSVCTTTQVGNCNITTTPATPVCTTPFANGQFRILLAGKYFISATESFASNGLGGIITLYIYKIDITGIIILLAANTSSVSVNSTTYNNVSTIAHLNSGDRIFFAITQQTGSSISTISDNRFVITRIGCI